LKFRPQVNVVFEFISVPYTITKLQAPETPWYIFLWAKCNDEKTCYSARPNAKKENKMKHNTQVRNRLFY